MLPKCILFLGSFLIVSVQGSHVTIRDFFQSCHSANKTICQSYHCFTRHHDLDLRHMDSLPCKISSDCLNKQTGLGCIRYPNGQGWCECPHKFAYNATSCMCQKARSCPPYNNSNKTFCHNGMRCQDSKCSCTNLSKTLFEPVRRFCVLPQGLNDEELLSNEEAGTTGQQQKTFLIIVCIIGAFVCLGVLAIVVYVCTENITCEKGDYECEEEKEEGLENHIAAWDMPSLDFLSEEQTMKYLKRHQERNNDYEISPTPSGSGRSLPESEQMYDNNRQKDHVNMAFVHDDLSKTSDSHDV